MFVYDKEEGVLNPEISRKAVNRWQVSINAFILMPVRTFSHRIEK